MKTPETYFEWKQMLDQFSQGDDSMMQFIVHGKMTMDAGTAVRYHQLVNDAYVKRKQLWLDKFKIITQNQIVKSSSDFAVYLNQAKSGLRVLIDFSNCAFLPEDLRKVLQEDLISFVAGVKQSLKSNITKSNNNQTNSLLLAVDNLDVHKVDTNNSSNASNINDNSPPNKRRIIF